MTRVILKADDYIVNPKPKTGFGHYETEEWERFGRYINKKGLKICLGIICNSLDDKDSGYYKGFKGILDSWEFFIHGHTHQMNEFCLSDMSRDISGSYHKHKKNINHCIALMKQKLNYEVATFGAPGNNMDMGCIAALREIKRIKCVFHNGYKDVRINDKLLLPYKSEENIEHPVHVPNLDRLKEIFDSDRDLYVFQVHPQSWDWNRFQQFTKCIDWLQGQGVEFVTPMQLYKEDSEAAKGSA